MTVSITSTTLSNLESFFESLPAQAEKAMALAINQVAGRDGLALIKRDMREDIEFPAGYLEGSRLNVVRKAGPGSLEAVIRARDRATSLARFAPGQRPGNTRGRRVQLKVAPGSTRVLKSAFLVSLKNGNTGLAVRLKPGDTMRHSQASMKLANNLYLLYGPSVEQVFSGVAEDRSGDIAEMVSKQFLRQFVRFMGNG